MRNRLFTSLAAGLFAVALAAGGAAPSDAKRAKAAAPPAACDVDAYVVDPDTSGLNVRETPGADGRVVAVIPLDADGTVVHLVASSPNGWVQIDRAETIGGAVVFEKKRGWVSGNMLGIATRGYGTKGVKLYAAAALKGKAVGLIPPEAEVKVAGCSGDRMKVKYGKLTGWLERESQCPSPVTNCN